MRSVLTAGPCGFHLVVPATPPKDHLTWAEGDAPTNAIRRLEEGLERLRALGATISGEVGYGSPVLAVDDAL